MDTNLGFGVAMGLRDLVVGILFVVMYDRATKRRARPAPGQFFSVFLVGLGTGGTRIGAVSVIIGGDAILVTHGAGRQRNSVNNGYTGFGGRGGHGVADVDVFGLLGNLEAGNMDLHRCKVLTHDGLPYG